MKFKNPPNCLDCKIPMRKTEEKDPEGNIIFSCPNCNSQRKVPAECIIETSE